MYQSFLLRTRASCRVPRAAPSTTQPSRRGAPQTSLLFAAGSASSWEEQQRRAVDYIAHNAPRAAVSTGGRWSPGVLAFVSRRANSTRPNPRLLEGRETEPCRVLRHLESSWTPLHSLIPGSPIHVSARSRTSSCPLLAEGLARSSPDPRPTRPYALARL